jgi:hypothetical protein
MSVAAMVCLAVALYAASMFPFLLLANVDHLTPRVVRRLPLTVAALLLIAFGGAA